jgi:UDP-N-acetylglucosamine 3-dehydrogenase
MASSTLRWGRGIALGRPEREGGRRVDRVKWGVIGLGFFGEKHCEALSGIPQVELHSLCTRTESRLHELARRFGISHTFTDYQRMLSDPELSAVSIVTMWDQHAAPTLAALAAGKHVFLEKPMASTMEDCQAIVEAARIAKGLFMVGHICRFNPRYASAKRAIDEGKIGRIVSLYARRNLPAAISRSVLDKIGPIVGDGVHDTDLMLWYTGERIRSVYARTVSVRDLTYPDIGWTMYCFESGAIGVVENAWFLPDIAPYALDERMEVIGTEGSLHIQESGPSLAVGSHAGWRYPDTTYWPLLHGVRTGALRDELTYFADCILSGRAPTIVTPEESMEAVRACLAAEQSAATGLAAEL